MQRKLPNKNNKTKLDAGWIAAGGNEIPMVKLLFLHNKTKINQVGKTIDNPEDRMVKQNRKQKSDITVTHVNV